MSTVLARLPWHVCAAEAARIALSHGQIPLALVLADLDMLALALALQIHKVSTKLRFSITNLIYVYTVTLNAFEPEYAEAVMCMQYTLN